MLSVYWAIALISGIFTINNFLKRKSGVVQYNKLIVIMSYLITRLVVVLMMNERPAGIWFSCIADFVSFVLVYVIIRNITTTNRVSNGVMLYIFNPALLIFLTSGLGARYIIVIAFVLWIQLMINATGVQLSERMTAKFYPAFIGLSYSIAAFMIAIDYLKQNFAMCSSSDNAVPTLLILSTAGIVISIAVMGVKLYKYKNSNDSNEELTYVQVNEITQDKRKHFSKRDWVYVLILTVGFAIVVFYKIGSTSAPESYKELTTSVSNGNELILDFGEDVSLAKMSIYLGDYSKRQISLSYLDENSGEWVLFDSKHNVESVFCWNDIDINKTIRKLGIVAVDSECYIHELVFIDSNGNQVLPDNYEAYPELFDEQDLYPEYPTYYYRTMFDEVYHARTAYEFVHGMSIYENTHPPLGKTIIGIGIRLFGMTPFGWRFMCAICGILMVPLIYYFIFRLTGKSNLALFGGLLLDFEFMHFTLSRIATIDIIVALFILGMFTSMYCFTERLRNYATVIDTNDSTEVRRKYLIRELAVLFLCGIITGCAMATKWTGVYAAAGIAIIFFTYIFLEYNSTKRLKQGKKHLTVMLGMCVLFFVLIPGTIYICAYRPFTKVYTDKNLLQHAISNAQLMLSYHSDTVFEHPFSSEWYEWAWIKRPLWDSITRFADGTVSSVATFGNPVIWWCGIAAVLHNFYLWFCKKNNNARFLLLAYMSMLIPWWFVHRTVFIYQYFSSALLIIPLIVNSVASMKKRQKSAIIVITELAGIAFIMFFTVISGITIKSSYISQVLEWLTTWKLV